ncbi:hypothetical protein QFC21_005712 [Naganishia friedmannii]|uniref:Uncharacterized protein n=1 Tax=Naganishia friedmannii TaxID=89922 RepID=A0ACC2V8F1_9TREE|nr:hypothetical protein QFC21_005712 [Naganishia friedmannii]
MAQIRRACTNREPLDGDGRELADVYAPIYGLGNVGIILMRRKERRIAGKVLKQAVTGCYTAPN